MSAIQNMKVPPPQGSGLCSLCTLTGQPTKKIHIKTPSNPYPQTVGFRVGTESAHSSGQVLGGCMTSGKQLQLFDLL